MKKGARDKSSTACHAESFDDGLQSSYAAGVLGQAPPATGRSWRGGGCGECGDLASAADSSMGWLPDRQRPHGMGRQSVLPFGQSSPCTDSDTGCKRTGRSGKRSDCCAHWGGPCGSRWAWRPSGSWCRVGVGADGAAVVVGGGGGGGVGEAAGLCSGRWGCWMSRGTGVAIRFRCFRRGCWFVWAREAEMRSCYSKKKQIQLANTLPIISMLSNSR